MRSTRAALVVSTVVAGLAAGAVGAVASVAPGTPGRDVTRGADNDVAGNTFIQPAGVAARQHRSGGDVLFGRAGDDLLEGNRGSDTLVGGGGDDLLVGGPDTGRLPGDDVALGDGGNDIDVWSPGDGNDVFVGDRGYDTLVVAPFLPAAHSPVQHVRWHGRVVPRVDIGGHADLGCLIVPVPASEHLGEQFLVRFTVDGTITSTLRVKDVERLLCPSPSVDRARVADLTQDRPRFRGVRLSVVRGTLGAVVAAP